MRGPTVPEGEEEFHKYNFLKSLTPLNLQRCQKFMKQIAEVD